MGAPPLVTGLTVVAFGTSAPELMVSVEASWRGQGGLALGSVMGSTVANVGFIVGTSLPELASSAAAPARGLGDVAVGNVIGSNVFNLGLVLLAAYGGFLFWIL